MSPTEERVRALKECETPTDVKLLRSFLCSVLWSARFMKDVNSIADPLWRLCKNGVPWQVEETAFQVYGVLQEGLADGTDIGREPSGARRRPLPIQPE